MLDGTIVDLLVEVSVACMEDSLGVVSVFVGVLAAFVVVTSVEDGRVLDGTVVDLLVEDSVASVDNSLVVV